MNRRDVLRIGLAAPIAAAGFAQRGRATTPRPTIMTVAGPITPDALGPMLTHEHVLVDFAPLAERTAEPTTARYDPDEVFDVVLPHLQALRPHGCRAMAEFTPAYLGRDPALLRRLSAASGLHLLTNTGFYGARNDQHLPPFVFTETADALAARWVREWTDGIDGTGIRPGFIKIGVDGGPLSDVDRKLVRAAARTHRRTGLTIAAHTGPAVPAFEQLEILAEEGVSAEAWIWTHAQNEHDPAHHVAAARRGAWVAFDGVAPASLERHVALVRTMKYHDLLERVLLSQDAGWYHVGEPGGGDIRPFTFFFTDFLPALRAAGLTEADLTQLTVTNPARAFTVQVRTR
ncbi:MAG: phosphotriesterase [Bacteroidetes bacterium]|nr:MAG: phosphotriesterase [Bacteroidota bacterium]